MELKIILLVLALSIFSFAYISAVDLSTTAMDSYKQAFIDIKNIRDKATLDSISIKEISLKALPKEVVIKNVEDTTIKMYQLNYTDTIKRNMVVVHNG